MISQTFSFTHVPPVFKRGHHVLIAIFDRDNRLYLSRKRIYPNDVYRLFGGVIESKEDPETAVKRELLEETGLKLDAKLVETFSFTLKDAGTNKKIIHKSFLFFANLKTRQIEPGDDVDGLRVFTKEDLLELHTVYSELTDILVTPRPEEIFSWKDWGTVFGVINDWIYKNWPKEH